LLQKLLLRRLLQRGTLRVEVENALAEREALERVSRVEAENAVAFASICEDAEGFVWKIALLEDALVVQRWP
jgi:hypothetical protein